MDSTPPPGFSVFPSLPFSVIRIHHGNSTNGASITLMQAPPSASGLSPPSLCNALAAACSGAVGRLLSSSSPSLSPDCYHLALSILSLSPNCCRLAPSVPSPSPDFFHLPQYPRSCAFLPPCRPRRHATVCHPRFPPPPLIIGPCPPLKTCCLRTVLARQWLSRVLPPVLPTVLHLVRRVIPHFPLSSCLPLDLCLKIRRYHRQIVRRRVEVPQKSVPRSLWQKGAVMSVL